MPDIECHKYNCRYISKTGSGCTAERIIVNKDTNCRTYQREAKGDRVENPRCHRKDGKWMADHHSVVK